MEVENEIMRYSQDRFGQDSKLKQIHKRETRMVSNNYILVEQYSTMLNNEQKKNRLNIVFCCLSCMEFQKTFSGFFGTTHLIKVGSSWYIHSVCVRETRNQ